MVRRSQRKEVDLKKKRKKKGNPTDNLEPTRTSL